MSFAVGYGWSGRNTGQESDEQLWQFRLRPLVLHSYSCRCPPQLYLVTVESAVAAPAGDLLSIGSPRGSDACHATEVAYTPSDFIGRPQWRIFTSLIGHRGGRRPGHNLTQLAGRWALRAAFSQRLQALYSLRLLRIGSAPRSLLIKRTPNKPGRC